ncbi:hypothetical protein Clacol_003898 [Clathrus columnatus]|uniref:Small VCP/p97-interacting protein n=1 Tax=Clathrus columnatus TaxID=1419009 RepID=A0AAV5A4X3_9AGAM|nr:hypothetical protein Clacol_003898 [Clathrus columnatus]
MGNICGCLLTHDDGQTLGPPQTPTTSARQQEVANPRNAAVAAAEERLKAEQSRGVNKANPNHGRLAAKLQASKSGATEPAEQPERIVWD